MELFDPLHDFELGSSVEDVASPPQQELQVLRDIASAKVYSLYRIVDGEAFKDWAGMANTVSAIQDDARRLTTSVQTEHGLLLEEYLRRAKLLKEDVCSFHSITVWIERWLCQKNGVLLGGDLQFVEDMSPKLLHIIPVLNDSVLNWIVEFENSSVFIL